MWIAELCESSNSWTQVAPLIKRRGKKVWVGKNKYKRKIWIEQLVLFEMMKTNIILEYDLNWEELYGEIHLKERIQNMNSNLFFNIHFIYWYWINKGLIYEINLESNMINETSPHLVLSLLILPLIFFGFTDWI